MALSICIAGHFSKHGAFAEGDQIRSDHPDVKANPECWAPEGLTTQEMHQAKQAYANRTNESIAKLLAERGGK